MRQQQKAENGVRSTYEVSIEFRYTLYQSKRQDWLSWCTSERHTFADQEVEVNDRKITRIDRVLSFVSSYPEALCQYLLRRLRPAL